MNLHSNKQFFVMSYNHVVSNPYTSFCESNKFDFFYVCETFCDKLKKALNFIGSNKAEMFLATIGTAAYGFLIFSNFIYPIYEDSIMKHPIESIQTIEESTTFEKIVGSLLYNIT